MAASLRKLKCKQVFAHVETFGLRRQIHQTNSRLKAKKAGSSEITSPCPAPVNVQNDWIGPPDKVSNIRQMKFHVPERETLVERQYREQRQALQEWHHEFWTKHNKSFFTLKEEFVKQRLADKQEEDSDGSVKSLSPEEMSEFYKKFLDENYKLHMQYNKEWYKKNLLLLWPAFKVCLIRLFFVGRNKSQSGTK